MISKTKLNLLKSPASAMIFFIIYLIMLIFTVLIGFYLVTYALFIIAFLFLIINFSNLKFYSILSEMPLKRKILYLFIIALVLRCLLLFQDQIITLDIVKYVTRSENAIAGMVPYEDFAVNKPPMYIYMLFAMGKAFGAGELQFRAFFSVMDSIVAVLLFYLIMSKYSEESSFQAGFAYAICPLPIVAIGLAGHYEPVVMIFVLLSFILLFKNHYYASALLLGIGFAFKFFPIVFLPFLAWTVKSWGQRILYIILFSIPMALSIIPIVLISPDAFYAYMYEQSYSWSAEKSFAFIYENLVGSQTFQGIRFSALMTALFFGFILVMFISWVRKKFDAGFWFKLILLIYLIYYGLLIAASLRFYESDLALGSPILIMLIFSLIYFVIIIFVFDRFLFNLEIKIKAEEEMFVLSAFALIFLLFSSSQFNPWYLLWPLPFLLAIENKYIRLILLWLLFWNFEGVGISLLPGFALA